MKGCHAILVDDLITTAGTVRSRRSGRETLCELQPGIFDTTAERQRLLLGMPVEQARPAEAH